MLARLVPFPCGCQSAANAVRNASDVSENIGLPKSQHPPATGLQGLRLQSVACGIPLDFRNPIARVVAARKFRKALGEIAAVPKVTVTEDNNALLRKHNIWSTHNTRVVKSIAHPSSVEFTAKGEFASCIDLCARGTSRP